MPRRSCLLPILALGMIAAASPAGADCAGWDPLGATHDRNARPLSAQDMIELVNFGRPDAEPVGGPSPIAISPDGRRAAIILQRADLAANDYCQALVVVDLDGRSAPRILDRGMGFMMTSVVFRAMYIPNGFPRQNAPAWTPDGTTIAFLKRSGGIIQLWRVGLDGRPASVVTHAAVDIDAWSWSADGRSLAYAVAAGRPAAEAAIDREGRTGWHYDARMSPPAGPRPQVPAPVAPTYFVVDPASGRESPATSKDRDRITAATADFGLSHLTGKEGTTVWIEPGGPSPLAGLWLRARAKDGKIFACAAPACRGRLIGIWWSGDVESVSLLKREGWNGRYAALYRWSPGHGQPELVLRTDDVIEGCQSARSGLLCIRQGATQPPRMVAIDPLTGAQRILFDPNPWFAARAKGQVQRIEWRNAKAREVYGDLVLPPGRQTARLPLIIVQYSSRGLLRGGTGNEYPIQLLAQRGFAVLSIEKPAMVAADDPSLKTFDDVSRANTKDWAERWNVDSAIQSGIDLLVARGIADPNRLGITGLSDGASSVRFALSNSRRFAAAAISTCCVDESSDALAGPAWTDYSAAIGYPPAAPVDIAFWKPYSVALNAATMDTPLLMQLADFEYLTALPAYTALRAYHRPVDLYVFPDEFHIKWRPQHRLAVFRRTIDWFSFWLKGEEDPAPAKAAQYAYWHKLRATRHEPP